MKCARSSSQCPVLGCNAQAYILTNLYQGHTANLTVVAQELVSLVGHFRLN